MAKSAKVKTLEISREEAQVLLEWDKGGLGWQLVEIEEEDGGILIGVTHPHSPDCGIDFHKSLAEGMVERKTHG